MFYKTDKDEVVDYDLEEALEELDNWTLGRDFWLSYEWNQIVIKRKKLLKLIKLRDVKEEFS